MRFLLGLLVLVFVSFQAPAGEMCVQDTNIKGGDATPWPWGSELRFPWSRIQGVWAPFEGDCDSYFMFKIGNPNSVGDRFIQITQYDPVTCKRIAIGAGFESDRVIYASMTSGNKSYDLTIRAFDTSVLKNQFSWPFWEVYPTGPAKSIILLTMYPKKNWEKRVSYQMEKLQSTPSLICDE
jgi:hypothetical protein